MKKLTAFFAVMLCTVCLIGCAKARYKLEIIDAYNYPIENTLKSSYAEGEEVTIKLETITEHYYVLYVNGVKQYAASHDMYYTYYTFTMPAEDVVVKIEDHWVGIPTPYDVIRRTQFAPTVKGGSICKELSRPIYILDVLWYNYFG